MVLLDHLLVTAKELPHESLAKMDELYGLSPVKNTEIRLRCAHSIY